MLYDIDNENNFPSANNILQNTDLNSDGFQVARPKLQRHIKLKLLGSGIDDENV